MVDAWLKNCYRSYKALKLKFSVFGKLLKTQNNSAKLGSKRGDGDLMEAVCTKFVIYL